MTFQIRPASWEDFSAAMGEKGGCGGCWCMLWRQSKKEMDVNIGEGNRLAMKAIFDAGHVPGLVARHGGKAVGWIQIDERKAFPRLEKSRVLKPVDDQPVWSVSCFFIHKDHRRQGLSVQLLQAACDWAKSCGAKIVEGYPVETNREKYPAVYAWTGFAGAYRAADFEEVARRSDTRPIMRKTL